MHKKRASEHTIFPKGMPPDPPSTIYIMGTTFCICPGPPPPNPLDSPVCNDSFQMGMANHFSRGQRYDHFLLLITKMQVITVPKVYLYDLSPRRAMDAARFF